MRICVLLLSSVVLLSGCMSPMIQPAQLAATHGYVYVNFPRGAQGQMMTLKSTRTNAQYILAARSDTAINSFGQWIPDGEYKIHKWGTSQWGGYPSISVKSGRLTDLGSLIPLQMGKGEFVMLPIRHKDFSKQVQLAINEYRSALSSEDPIYWEPKVSPAPMKNEAVNSGLGIVVDLMLEYERHLTKTPLSKQLRQAHTIDELFGLAKAATPPLSGEPSVDAQSNLYYGGDLGQIRVRHVSGEWRSIDTGALHPVTSVEVYGEQIFAGFDNGVIRKSDDGGRAWKEIVTLGYGREVADIDRVNDKWYVILADVVTNNLGFKIVKRIEVLESARADFSDLHVIRRVAVNEQYFFGIHGEAANGNYYVSLYPRLERLDTKSMEWKDVTPPTKVFGFHVSNNANVISTYSAMGAFSKLYVSKDRGATWVKYDAPPYIIQDVIFRDNEDGQAVRWSVGAFSGKIEFMKYDHKNDSWVRYTEAPQGCVYALKNEHGLSEFCVSRRGDILRNNGSAWTVEFSPE